MKAKNYVKQFTQPSQEMQTIGSGETGSVACKPEGEERQTSERTPEGLEETERANFRRRRDELLAEAKAERDMFVNENDNQSDSSNEGSVDGPEEDACTMYVDFDEFSLSQT